MAHICLLCAYYIWARASATLATIEEQTLIDRTYHSEIQCVFDIDDACADMNEEIAVIRYMIHNTTQQYTHQMYTLFDSIGHIDVSSYKSKTLATFL